MRPKLSVSLDQIDGIVESLRRDYDARNQFLSDPGEVLQTCGLSADQGMNLESDLQGLTTEAGTKRPLVNVVSFVNAVAIMNAFAAWNVEWMVVAHNDTFAWGYCDMYVQCYGSR